MTQAPRGRYAPSPTGELHLGNASSALLAWLSCRSRGGGFVMRMEDLDRNRVREELGPRILDDLRWLGLDWDEGPDRGGPHAPYEQWTRREHYREAYVRLQRAGLLYPCFCSRRDIAAAASAPQAPGDELRYPGTCRDLDPDAARRRIDGGDRHAWRFRVCEGQGSVFEDLVHGEWGRGLPPPGDFVVYRADDVPAYQLAVVVDDAAMEIDEVVRGDDLLPSTVRQLLLYAALQEPPPVFAHVPLLLGADGVRLSKRHSGVTLRELRERGFTPEELVGRLAQLLGLRRGPEPLSAAELIEGFSFETLRPAAREIVVDPAAWRPASG
jgi:glutamyl-tRNA synthetase